MRKLTARNANVAHRADVQEGPGDLEIQIILPLCPLGAASRSSTIWIVRDHATYVLERELTLKFVLEHDHSTDEFCACLLQYSGRRDAPVRLDLDEEVRLERIGTL